MDTSASKWMRIVAGFVFSLFGALALLAVPAAAQEAVERNLPPPVPSVGTAIEVALSHRESADDTPLGVDVAGLHLIGATADIPAGLRSGLSLGAGLDRLPPGIDVHRLDAALAPVLGRPLSLSLILEAQSIIARLWQDAGYPFVSVTVPPQDVTAGILTLRIVEFSVGRIKVDPPVPGQSAGLSGHLRLRRGDAIDVAALNEDLDWLNRNPFRRVGLTFSPGDDTGSSDVTIELREDRPFSIFAGWNDGGSDRTGRDRWSVGGSIWFRGPNHALLSYRFTRSEDIWGGAVFSPDAEAGSYMSHAARLDLPTGPRQALSIAPNHVETNEVVEGTGFSFRNKVTELPVLYYSALSNLLPGRFGEEIYFGVEPKRLSRETSFGGEGVASGRADLFNLVLGWSRSRSDGLRRSDIDLRLKANLSGVGTYNSARDWAEFSGGRVDDHRYIHLGADLLHRRPLPQEILWTSRIFGSAAGQALPDSERTSLGGGNGVRGYETNDADVDTGVIWRNELHASHPTFAEMTFPDGTAPFAFLDWALGYDFADKRSRSLSSLGLGVDLRRGGVSASVTGAVALQDSGRTETGDASLHASIFMRF